MRTKLPVFLAIATGLASVGPGAFAANPPPADPIVSPAQQSSAPVVQSIESVQRATAQVETITAPTWTEVCSSAFYKTIQDAVDGGAEYIHVCAGNYPEDVAVASTVKEIKGDGIGQTVITGTGSSGPILDVAAGSNVKIQHLTVDGQSALSGSEVYGIRYTDASGEIKHVEVLNVRTSGTHRSYGILVETVSGEAKVVVASSKVENYTRGGIIGNGLGVHLTALFNKVSGPIGDASWAPNGIQVARGATGRIAGNRVDNNPSPNPPGGAGSGIILFCAGKTLVAGNTVTRADLGISLADQANATIIGNIIKDSEFEGISLQFLGLYFGEIGCTTAANPLPTENNRVSANLVRDSGDTGIILVNYDSETESDTPNNNQVSRNRVFDSGNIGVYDDSGIRVYIDLSDDDANPSDNRITSNNIKRSNGNDAVDDTEGTGTAGTANIWLRNRCTTEDPVGLCI